MASDVPVLWHLKVSNYNEKARWALDYKRIPHARRAVDPGRHRAIAKRLTGGRTFPVLVIDGEAIGDSTKIVAELERRHPERPLYPADAGERRQALEVEDFFDEELGPYVRLLVISQLLQDPPLIIETFFPDAPVVRRLAARALFPLYRRKAKSAFGIDDAGVKHAVGKVLAANQRFREQLQPGGYLVGNDFSIADLSLAALVAPAVAPPQFPYAQPQRGHPLLAGVRDLLAQSGLLDWVHHIYARHRAPSAEVR